MKTNLRKCLLPAAFLAFAGCFSFEASSFDAGRAEGLRLHTAEGRPVKHVVVANNGWFLFNHWPLACGNAALGASFPWRFFRNDVDQETLHARLTEHAYRLGCDVEELNVFNDEQVLLSIPGTSFPLPLPYILTYREMQISGILVKRAARPAGGAR